MIAPCNVLGTDFCLQKHLILADTYLFPYRSWGKPGGERADYQNPEGEAQVGPTDVKGRPGHTFGGHNLLPGREGQAAAAGSGRRIVLRLSCTERDLLPPYRWAGPFSEQGPPPLGEADPGAVS